MLDQMLREHPPGTMSLVHPMFGDVDYGPLDEFTRFKVGGGWSGYGDRGLHDAK